MNYFSCPFDETGKKHYTTDECSDCFCFWDCEVGLKECLKDKSFKDYHEEINDALNDL